MPGKDCPMCGEIMYLRPREIKDRLPGTQEVATIKLAEWVCPECDYFEDAEDGDSR